MKDFIVRRSGPAMVAALSLLPLVAAAQTLPPPPFTDPSGAIVVLCRIAGWLFTFLIILTIIFVILAAWNYLTAGGDTEKVKTATTMLIYAGIAIAVGLIARGFPLLVVNLIGAAAVTGC